MKKKVVVLHQNDVFIRRQVSSQKQ